MHRKASNKENVNPANKPKLMHVSHTKIAHGKKASCSSLPKNTNKINDRYKCTQKELSHLKRYFCCHIAK